MHESCVIVSFTSGCREWRRVKEDVTLHDPGPVSNPYEVGAGGRERCQGHKSHPHPKFSKFGNIVPIHSYLSHSCVGQMHKGPVPGVPALSECEERL